MHVHFTGAGRRSGGLTWAQEDIYGYAFEANLGRADVLAEMYLPGGAPVGRCLEAVEALTHRHETLRTTFARNGPGRFRTQHVADEGVIPVFTHPSDQSAICRRLTDGQIDVTRDLPVRVGLVAERGVATWITLVMSRMVVDGWGLENVIRQFGRAVTDGGADEGDAFHQLDQWEWEQSHSGRRHADVAVAYREKVLASAAGAGPSTPIEPAGGGAIRRGALSLPGGFNELLVRLSAELSLSTSPLLLTACAMAASQALGLRRLMVHLHCANRFDAPRQESVTRLKGMSLMPYGPVSDRLEEEVRRVAPPALAAYRNAQLSPDAAAAALDRAAPADLFLVEFNDRRAAKEGSAAGAAPGAVATDGPIPVRATPRVSAGPYLGFAIDRRDAGGLTVQVDTNVLADEAITELLLDVAAAVTRSATALAL